MYKIVVAAGAFVAVHSDLFSGAALADGVRFPIKLPNCPTPLTITAPASFVGGNPKGLFNVVDTYTRDGNFALAMRSPIEPSFILAVKEPGGIGQIQGEVTPAQFEDLKAQLQTRMPDDAALEANRRLQETGHALSDVDALSFSSDATSATQITILTTDDTITDFAGTKISYVQQCVAAAFLTVPTSSMSGDEFAALMQSLTIE